MNPLKTQFKALSLCSPSAVAALVDGMKVGEERLTGIYRSDVAACRQFRSNLCLAGRPERYETSTKNAERALVVLRIE